MPVTQHKRRNRLLLAHTHLVQPIARYYAALSPEPLDDLIQVGMLGLLQAAGRYCPELATPFDCYARPHIRGAILHHLRDATYAVRIPRRQAEAARSPWSALQRTIPLEPRDADRLEAPLTTWAADAYSYTPLALSAAWAQCSAAELLRLVEPRQRRVLRAVVLKGWSYRRTARSLGVSAPTVQRLLHRALARLRQQLTTGRSGHRAAVALNLLAQGADGRIQGSKATLGCVTPAEQQL